MSKIFSPFPPPLSDEIRTAKEGHSWWRFRLRPNEDGHLVVQRTDGTAEEFSDPTWISWEIFDGEDAIVDAGFDRPVPAIRMAFHERIGTYIDILSVEQPTLSPFWLRLTRPGEPHPDDLKSRNRRWP